MLKIKKVSYRIYYIAGHLKQPRLGSRAVDSWHFAEVSALELTTEQ